ncbi:TonB-dependent receptor [Thalassotalea sp. Y01]|uniref:TonB-dependent receptor n=1 Tax=Thalassotalea sp. Y01 TaxID=2729613 RepID=UPI00145DA166|nr:TonB-dependent receptor [Thalassotalea sp. Y01]NMP15936.1 TonB-dependent receptor [Thalassotalea sp. Y01]
MATAKTWGLALLPMLVSASLAAQDITGIVVDKDGNALKNAKVKLKSQTIYTDEQGRFSFTELDAKDHEIHISATGYGHISKQVLAANNAEINVILSPSPIEVVDVYATPLHTSNIESALPVNVLAADELRRKQAATLGDTLKGEVGVHSTSYGSVSSSPVIRGQDGPRVLITQNGLDVADASRVGPDHIVAAEASTAQQIEVLRGPSTLFYGSGAIGGVVNVVDNRVPTNSDNRVDYMTSHDSVNDQDAASLAINTGSDSFALHVDGFWRESNDVDIPGHAELHDEHDEDHDDGNDEHEEHDEHEGEAKGTIENTAAKSTGFNIGTSYLLDNGYIGISYGRLDREYGIPGHAHGEEHEEHDELEGLDEHDEHEEHEEMVSGELEQDRYQMLSDLTFDDSFINRVATKLAYTDYEHREIEGGEVGTQFNNEMFEARADLYHHEVNGWKGAWTLHYKDRDFEAIGDEAFSPPSETTSVAFGWLEEKHFGDVLWQIGARIEYVELSSDGDFFEHDEEHEEHQEEFDEHEGEEHASIDDQDFTPVSLSVGAVWDYQPGYNLGFSVSYSQRAPSAAELFANGPHIGTNTYEVGAIYDVEQHDDHVDVEVGSQNVDLETSYNLDLTWRKFEGDFGFVLSAFYNQVEDYYYQQNTGFFAEDGHEHEDEVDMMEEDDHGDEEGLPIYAYRQADVDMYGLEAEFVYQISQPLQLSVIADYIRAELSDGGNLPRIPPMRIGSELAYEQDSYVISTGVTHYFEQDDVAEMETSTDSYTMVDANLNVYLDNIGDDFVIFFKGQNLTDEEGRVHGSFLKDIAPLPGRNFSVGIRGSF